ncbi:MAG TPA: glycosyltransferase [Holophagaceae bacterium]|nr:glycosyltransferase [Holophagaceae bacterium]
MSRRIVVLFIINSLAAGGAERQLTELCRNLDKDRFDIHVAVFYGPGNGNLGDLWPEMAALPGVRLHDLRKRRGPLGYLVTLPRLAALILRTKADILHGYLNGNLPALLLGAILRRRVVWGVRRSFANLGALDRLSLRLLAIRIRLARFTDLMIFNSQASLSNHEALGLKGTRTCVIPNGFDTDRFRPDADLRKAQRTAWGVPEDALLVGIVGRLDPVKDHSTFLHAAARLSRDLPQARFVCVGRGDAAYAERLAQLAATLGLEDRVLWTGVSREMPSVYNALDALALTSIDEGFPNVIGEAMATGVPCVATRVGDAALLVGDLGHTAAPGDAEAIHRGLLHLLTEGPEERRRRSLACRAHLVERYGVKTLAHRTGTHLLEILEPPVAPRGQ